MIAIATLVMCLAFSRQRLSIVIPYAVIAASLADWMTWTTVTLLVLAWAMVSELDKSLRE